LPDNLTRILDDNGNALGGVVMPNEPSSPTSNSIYALIPPIKF